MKRELVKLAGTMAPKRAGRASRDRENESGTETSGDSSSSGSGSSGSDDSDDGSAVGGLDKKRSVGTKFAKTQKRRKVWYAYEHVREKPLAGALGSDSTKRMSSTSTLGLASLKGRAKSASGGPTRVRNFVTALTFRALEHRWVPDRDSPWFGAYRALSDPPAAAQTAYWPENHMLPDNAAWMCAYERWRAAREALQPIMRRDCSPDNIREAAPHQRVQFRAYLDMRRIAHQHSIASAPAPSLTPPTTPPSAHIPAPYVPLPSRGAKTSSLRPFLASVERAS